MRDIRKDRKFFYSQASLTAFEKCPLKFRRKYMEGINWKSEEGDEDFFFKSGREFHLNAERYFSGIDIQDEMITEEKQRIWMERLRDKMKINEKDRYLPEHEIKMAKHGIRIQGKYDLVIIKNNGNIEIYDWKSEPNKLKQTNMEKKNQTILYMYMVAESGIAGKIEDYTKISMRYWQPEFPEDMIIVSYSYDKHLEFEEKIKKTIGKIDKFDFDKKEEEQRNHKNCDMCEFKSVCTEQPQEMILDYKKADIENVNWNDIEKINI